MRRDEAVRLAKAHGLTDPVIDALSGGRASLESSESRPDTEPTEERFLPELQRQGLTALLALYDGNREVFAEWVATEGCGEAIESCRGLL